jgi:hypothetical protein
MTYMVTYVTCQTKKLTTLVATSAATPASPAGVPGQGVAPPGTHSLP